MTIPCLTTFHIALLHHPATSNHIQHHTSQMLHIAPHIAHRCCILHHTDTILCLSWQTCVSRNKHNFVTTSMCFVMTKVCLLRQVVSWAHFCHNKSGVLSWHKFWGDKCMLWQNMSWQKYACQTQLLSGQNCRDKSFVTRKCFAATKMCLWQNCFAWQTCVSRSKPNFVRTKAVLRHACFCCDKRRVLLWQSFCWDAIMFEVATNQCLSWQHYVCCNIYLSQQCCDKTFVATGIFLSWLTRVCSNKTRLVLQQKYAYRDKTFVVAKLFSRQPTSILLSWQKGVLSRQTHVCCVKTTVAETNCDKIMFVAKKVCCYKRTFVVTKEVFLSWQTCLSWQNYCHRFF